MKSDRLKKLAGDERFIPGIYNYCDRWCERCSKTSRCLNFALSEEEFADPESRDIRNEAFWKKMTEVFSDTLELLKEAAREHGVDLETLDAQSSPEEDKKTEEMAENHEVCRAARTYGHLVDGWFTAVGNLFPASPAFDGEEMSLEEALEVVRWYQHFIYVKLMRAVRGELEDRDEELDEFPRDSDGSAKIALIAIDRSIGAWGTIYAHDLLRDEKTLRLVAYLDRLREEVENAFPGARPFIRPGFDTTEEQKKFYC
jgi:hypothetical protein